MLKWTPYVMVRICLFFVAGILTGIYQPDFIPESLAIYITCTLLLFYLIIYWVPDHTKMSQIISGFIGLVSIYLFGYLQLLNHTDSRLTNHLISETDPIGHYEAIVRSAPESKARSWKLEVEVTRVNTSEWKNVRGKVLLYLSKKSSPEVDWKYGDRLLIQGSPNLIAPPANPHEFNYKRFLTFKNIYHQHFLTAESVLQVTDAEQKGIIHYSIRARAWATEKVRKYIETEKAQAIAMALVLGVTDGIDTDLQNAYAASGAMHVLAVSGLHVGIIYGILLLVLKPLSRYAWSRWVVFGISIVCLWSFAFITGLSPSVLRAVTMFSFIALARPLGWKTNIYNTLAGSAFLLLLYNPYLIMSVGFQLSYLAVLGIVYLQRPIYNLLEVESRVGDWVWQITCVSIAAQAATFALGMLYFHQFPVYFLVSNLFVIPLSTIVLVIGIVFLIASPITSVASIIGSILSFIINVLNWLVLQVEQLPFSLIEEIHLTTFQCWLIMIFIMSLVFLIEFKSFKWIYILGLVAALVLITHWNHYRQSVSKRQFVVYAVNGHTAMEWIDNGMSFFKADSALIHDTERMRFHIRPSRLNGGVNEIYYDIPFGIEMISGVFLYRWQNSTVVHWQSSLASLPELPEMDYLVVSKNAFKVDWINQLKIESVILDGTNSRNYINKWKEIASSGNIQVHSVSENGAFILIQ
jgi:competence protein ComEC